MSGNSKKVSELPIAANVATTDRVMVLRDPNGIPSVRTANMSVLFANIEISNTYVSNSSANGIMGNMRFDIDYLYVCVANNTWKRVSLNSW